MHHSNRTPIYFYSLSTSGKMSSSDLHHPTTGNTGNDHKDTTPRKHRKRPLDEPLAYGDDDDDDEDDNDDADDDPNIPNEQDHPHHSHHTTDSKVLSRREANRLHALKSRQRSKQLLQELQQTIQHYNYEKMEYERQNAILTAQVEVLRQQNLALLQQQTLNNNNNNNNNNSSSSRQQNHTHHFHAIPEHPPPPVSSSSTTTTAIGSTSGTIHHNIPTPMPQQQQQPLHPAAALQQLLAAVISSSSSAGNNSAIHHILNNNNNNNSSSSSSNQTYLNMLLQAATTANQTTPQPQQLQLAAPAPNYQLTQQQPPPLPPTVTTDANHFIARPETFTTTVASTVPMTLASATLYPTTTTMSNTPQLPSQQSLPMYPNTSGSTGNATESVSNVLQQPPQTQLQQQQQLQLMQLQQLLGQYQQQHHHQSLTASSQPGVNQQLHQAFHQALLGNNLDIVTANRHPGSNKSSSNNDDTQAMCDNETKSNAWSITTHTSAAANIDRSKDNTNHNNDGATVKLEDEDVHLHSV